MTPTISVDDPLLMLGMPKGLTAATGMDALTHAIEAYVSTASTPVTDACALHAIRLVSSYLRTAVLHGDNLEARDMMRYGHTACSMLPTGRVSYHGALGEGAPATPSSLGSTPPPSFSNPFPWGPSLFPELQPPRSPLPPWGAPATASFCLLLEAVHCI